MSTIVLPSRLPEAPENKFQRIKKIRAAAEARGIKILNLAIGQPAGPALESARRAAATAVMSEAESMHEYQDNSSPGVPDFAKKFVQHQVKSDLAPFDLGYLPVPGLKASLKHAALACGASRLQSVKVATMTDPGYPTPAYWCELLAGIDHMPITLNPENSFRFSLSDIAPFDLTEGDLIMMNYPHNPSGAVASREWLQTLCRYALNRGIRLWNDAAYAVLSHSDVHTTLTDVALDFPGLSWAEGFSGSKAIGNGTGWRVGAIVGSKDFVGDITRIKGDDDSGFVAFAAAGVLAAFETDMKSIEANRKVFGERLKILIDILQNWGMKLAVEPQAGFFSLWLTPKEAFGQEVRDAEHFNALMIENTGVLGVPFDPYIRYAVTQPIHKMASEIRAAFEKAQVRY